MSDYKMSDNYKMGWIMGKLESICEECEMDVSDFVEEMNELTQAIKFYNMDYDFMLHCFEVVFPDGKGKIEAEDPEEEEMQLVVENGDGGYDYLKIHYEQGQIYIN